MRFILGILALTVLLATATKESTASIVTWGIPTTISGDSDVSTNGTLFGAGNLADADSLTINGVTFPGITFTNGVALVISGDFRFGARGLLGVDGPFSSASNPFAGLSTDYQDLLDSGMFTHTPPSAPPAITLVITNLTIGQLYEFQWWVNDSRDTGDFDRTTTAAAGNSVTLEHNFANAEGGVGQFGIGTFTADSTTQQIVFTGTGAGTNVGSTQINAFQLRSLPQTGVIPEPTSLLCWTGLALFGAGALTSRRILIGGSLVPNSST